MGWLNEQQQLDAKKKYGVRCFYVCNYCELPIPPGALYKVDPKGGYFPWRVPKNARSFTAREPKVTYHIGGECEDMRLRRHKNKYRKKQMLRAAEYILDKIELNPQKTWTRERCTKRLLKKGYEESVVKKALKFIRKEKLVKKKSGGYKINVQSVQLHSRHQR